MTETGRRQQPGYACEECRRRKARCDRTRPTCGLCAETGTVCVILDRKSQRGPKKGQLNAMRSQIANLQRQLNQQLGWEADNAPVEVSGPPSPEGAPDRNDIDLALSIACISPTTATHDLINVPTSATSRTASEPSPLNTEWADWTVDYLNDLGHGMGTMGGGLKLPMLPPSVHIPDLNDVNMHLMGSNPLPPPSVVPMLLDDSESNGDGFLTDDIRADLDQVYFERVHPVLPIIYRRRYFSWSEEKSPGPARACLRSAMRAMAAAMSAPGTRFCDQLYAETSRMLQSFSVTSKDDISIEYIQAWLLLGHFELLRVGEHQAMLTAGRCLRLVIMARLFAIDAVGSESSSISGQTTPGSMVSSSDAVVSGFGDTFSDVEERRRTFWVANCLDRFLCTRNEYPLTLQEEMICTRLPAPEANFQNNQPFCANFLPEAIVSPPTSQKSLATSSFVESIVLATLHGRCMIHRRSYITKESQSGVGSSGLSPGEASAIGGDFWTRQQRLASAVEKRVQILGSTAAAVDSNDAMLLFARMLAHSAVIKLGQAAQVGLSCTAGWRTTSMEQQRAVFERRAASAATEMVRLATQIPSFHCFKAHPFLPDPLGYAASYLGEDGGAQQLLRVLGEMQGMNSLARGYFSEPHPEMRRAS